MLEVAKIDLHYGAAQALRAVSLTATPGEVTCVLGRNGVGKTASLLRPDRRPAAIAKRPRSSVEGRRYFQVAAASPAPGSGIGYVPQGREIFPLLTVERESSGGIRAAKARRAQRFRTT